MINGVSTCPRNGCNTKKFMHCVIKFQQQLVFVTGIDLFCHFQKENDDCATGMFLGNSKRAIARSKEKRTCQHNFRKYRFTLASTSLCLQVGLLQQTTLQSHHSLVHLYPLYN